MGSYAGALEWWNNCNCAGAHIIVKYDGTIVLTAPIDGVAWHAGTNPSTARNSYWAAHNANVDTIGVEMEGHGTFTEAQIQAALRLRDWGEAKYSIPRQRIRTNGRGHLGHEDISNQRSDPGRHFPWSRLLA